jgi:hypothetical protein
MLIETHLVEYHSPDDDKLYDDDDDDDEEEQEALLVFDGIEGGSLNGRTAC